jgi:hypothetical protein
VGIGAQEPAVAALLHLGVLQEVLRPQRVKAVGSVRTLDPLPQAPGNLLPPCPFCCGDPAAALLLRPRSVEPNQAGRRVFFRSETFGLTRKRSNPKLLFGYAGPIKIPAPSQHFPVSNGSELLQDLEPLEIISVQVLV